MELHLSKGVGQMMASSLRKSDCEDRADEGDDPKGEEGHIGGGQGGEEKG